MYNYMHLDTYFFWSIISNTVIVYGMQRLYVQYMTTIRESIHAFLFCDSTAWNKFHGWKPCGLHSLLCEPFATSKDITPYVWLRA